MDCLRVHAAAITRDELDLRAGASVSDVTLGDVRQTAITEERRRRPRTSPGRLLRLEAVLAVADGLAHSASPSLIEMWS
jgi:hypothetical protein